MKKEKKTEAGTLRKKAEEIIKERRAETVTKLTEKENLKVMHELKVHQIELELQNEELMIAKEKAEEISDKYVELYDFAPVGYFTLSREGDILGMNLLGANKLGRERSKLINSHFAIFFLSVETRDVFNMFLERVFKSGNQENCEVILLSEGQSPVDVDIIGIVSENKDKCLLTVIDVTEKKLANEKLISEQAFRSSIEASLSSGIAIVDDKGIQTYVNPSFCRLFGWTSDELTGAAAPFVYWPPEQLQSISESFQLTIEDKAPKEGFELVFKSKDGTLIPVQVIISPFSDGKHRTGWLANVIDITKRKKMEEAIVESEEKYRTLFETERDSLFLIDKETFEILDVNDSACSMYGYSKEEMLKMKNYDVSAEPEETIKNTQNMKERISLRYHKKKDGTVFPVHISANEISYRNRRVIFAAIRDITEQMKYESEIVLKNEELGRINAEKDKFFSIIAHDLRSPFTGFLGFTEMMKSGLKDFSLNELQVIVNKMSTSANNLFALLTNLLEWSMIQRGLTAFNPIKISVKDAVENVSVVFYDIAENKGITMNLDIPGDVFIAADKAMLETILRNLISNALKFSNKGGNVTISAKTNKEFVELSVRDSGIGMDSELLNEIFSIDKKSGRKGTAEEPSTGLGLILCKEFAEKHNGRISINSEEGKGSEFVVSFPVI